MVGAGMRGKLGLVLSLLALLYTRLDLPLRLGNRRKARLTALELLRNRHPVRPCLFRGIARAMVGDHLRHERPFGGNGRVGIQQRARPMANHGAEATGRARPNSELISIF
jgi:hypothetical protein